MVFRFLALLLLRRSIGAFRVFDGIRTNRDKRGFYAEVYGLVVVVTGQEGSHSEFSEENLLYDVDIPSQLVRFHECFFVHLIRSFPAPNFSRFSSNQHYLFEVEISTTNHKKSAHQVHILFFLCLFLFSAIHNSFYE